MTAALPIPSSETTLLRLEPSIGQPPSLLPVITLKEDDRAGVNALIESLIAEPRRSLIVDMIGATFCGTMRLGVLLRMHQALRRNGRVLRVAVDHPELIEVFRLTRLNTIIAIFSTLEGAIDEAKRQP